MVNKFFISAFVVFLCSLSVLVRAQDTNVDSTASRPSYPVKYQYGDLTIEKKTNFSLYIKPDALELIPESRKKSKAEMLKLPVEKSRGAKPAPNGVWIYWFGQDSATKSAFFSCPKEFIETIVSQINDWTQDYYQQKYRRFKQQYEEYEKKAIEESN